ncbi:MAG: PKD domain-containing protein [Planctomycetes bacterium]|nr:PKD domain-containing protein [Planctomycetota bacterium]
MRSAVWEERGVPSLPLLSRRGLRLVPFLASRSVDPPRRPLPFSPLETSMQRTLLLSAVALGLASASIAQSTVVIPNGMANAAGSTANTFPWYRTTSWPGLRILACYDSSHFTAQTINYPILITGVKWRANDSTASWTGGTHSQATVAMSTAAVDYLALTTNWAANHGPDYTVMHSGPVTMTAGTGNGTGVPGPWFVDVPFATPFLYDPSSGNDLIIDTDNDFLNTTWSGGTTTSHDIDGSATAMSSRVYGSSLYPAANGTTLGNHGIIIEVSYTPAAGLYAGFSADVTTGPSPLTVNFTDRTFSSDPGGVQSWAWDFENDGTVDSTAQNPTHTYTACGTYDVKLEVTDLSHPNSVLVRTGLISTDETQADFTDGLIAPLVVQFTDTSTGNPTSWSWDLDGDGTADSTAQNPAWVYATGSPVTVSLTVSRLCGPSDTITRTIVPLQQISTGLVRNNGNGNYGSILFNLDVLNAGGVTIDSLDIYASTVVQTCNLDMYVRQGDYTGHYLDREEWVLVGTATGTSSGVTTTPFNVVFNSPVYLPPGVSGVKLHYRDFYCSYTTGTAVQAFGNSDVQMIAGTSQYTTATDAFVGTTLTPRWFAGTIYYSTHNFTGNAGYGAYGAGCAGTMGVSNLTPSGNPVLGTTLTVTVDNMPVSAGIMVTGFSNSAWALGALPYDLSGFGATGCFLRVSTDSNLFIAGASNSATWSLVIPNAAALSGTLMYQQAIVLDPTANGAGAVGSNASALLFGN